MKDRVPLFQTLVWPVFLVGIFIYTRKWNSEIFKAIKTRIIQGCEISIGTSGISLGSAPRLEASVSSDEQALINTLPEKIPANEQTDAALFKELEQLIYLIRGAEFYRTAGGGVQTDVMCTL